VERFLSRHTTRIIAVSDEIAGDLVAFGVTDRAKITVVPLGFDLAPFAHRDDERDVIRARTRDALGISAATTVVTLIARVVKVKRVDRFIEMARRLAGSEDVRFLVVGDGALRVALQQSRLARELGDKLVWAGFRRDIPAICFASDVIVLTSDNEGTPVCLIEAQAAGLPVVATDVGGVRTVVRHGESGMLVGCDSGDLAAEVRTLLHDPIRRAAYGAAGRQHALAAFSIERLVSDIDGLYKRLIAEHAEQRAMKDVSCVAQEYRDVGERQL
jgi:glycosyltransferase involved in cell wall biosynthesis